MRTVNKVGGTNGTTYTEFYGNTTDVKPTEDVPNGSAFYEVDNNMQEYRFDKENKIWYPITRGGTAPSGDYLPLSGGIMTGDINMDGNSLLNAKSITLKDETGEYTVKMDLVNLGAVKPETGEPFFYEAIEFADPNDNNKLFVISGVADPLLETDAVNLRYLDSEIKSLDDKYVAKTGGTMTGALTVVIDGHSSNTGILIAHEDSFGNPYMRLSSESIMISPTSSYSTSGKGHITVTYEKPPKDKTAFRFYTSTYDGGSSGTQYNYARIMVGTPTDDEDATTKKYVDDSISTLTTTIGDNYIPLTGTADGKPVSGSIVLSESGSINAGNIIFNQNIIQVFPNLKESEWRSDFANGGINYFWNNNCIAHLRPLQIDSIGFSTITASIRFSNIGMPIATTDAANKAYVDQETAKYLPLTGTATDKPVTGDIVFDGTHTVTGVKEPENDTDVVTKKYADVIKEDIKNIQELDEIYEGIDLSIKFAEEIKKYSDIWQWIKAKINTGNFAGIHINDFIRWQTTDNRWIESHVAGINTYRRYGDIEVQNHIDFISKDLWSELHIMSPVNFNNGLIPVETLSGDGSKTVFTLTKQMSGINNIMVGGEQISAFSYDTDTYTITFDEAPASGTNNITVTGTGSEYPWLSSDLYLYLNSLKGQIPNSIGKDPAVKQVDYTNDGIWSKLPVALKKVIVNKRAMLPKRYSASDVLLNNNSWGWENMGNLWLPSEVEVYGCSVWGDNPYDKGGFVQYPIFKNNMRRVKGINDRSRNNWWLISATANSAGGFCSVNAVGNANTNSPLATWIGAPVCFRIS